MADKATAFELFLAMAINGPWDLGNNVKNSKFTLIELRKARWEQLDRGEQASLVYGIRSLIKTLKDRPDLMILLNQEISK